MNADNSLDGPSWGPANGGAPDSLVVLLHGWGADGFDLIDLAPHWGPHLPGTLFVAPNAPEICEMNPMGRQWFSLGDMTPAGGLSEAQVRPRADAIRPVVDVFIDDQLAMLELADDRLAVVGFSQGTMVGLHVAVRRPKTMAAFVGYSGRLIGAADIAQDAASKPPILLVHGAADDVVPADSTEMAARDLTAAGFEVEAHIRPGLGHGIDPEGLALGGAFLAARLGG